MNNKGCKKDLETKVKGGQNKEDEIFLQNIGWTEYRQLQEIY